MFSSFTSALFGDGRAMPAIAAVVALFVIAGLGYWVYRLAFATRLRPSGGGGRARAPRMGVVDVFGLDGQRQLVIVRRDNVEHLLLLGGPNDLLVEGNIQRSANGRDAPKSAGDGLSEAPPPIAASIPAPVAAPAKPAAIRREPVRAVVEEPTAPAEPEIVAPPPRPRPTPPPPRPLSEAPPLEAPRSEPKPFMTVEPAKPYATAEPIKPVVAPEPAKPVVIAEPPRPVAIYEPVKTAETPPAVKPAEAVAMPEPLARVVVEPPRKPAPPRPVAPVSRPSLPPPITPPRARIEAAPEPMKPAPEPMKPAPAPSEPPLEPPVAVKPVLKSDIVVAGAPSPPAPKSKKDEAFYDLESLEAEMARLLGRDP